MKLKALYDPFLLLFVFCIGISSIAFSQTGFQLPKGKTKDRIPFELINNLAVISVEVNGKELSFLLDTGVNHTLLFSLDRIDSIQINNVTPVKIRGLGGGGEVDAVRSVNNRVRVGDALDRNHMVYVIFDQRINFSPRMGIPIHGVIGYDLFKDFVVKTNYSSEQITLYDPQSYKAKPCKPCETFDLTFSQNKPYITNKIRVNGQQQDVTLLIDSGASDAIWLFDEKYGIQEAPKNYFEDFLGLGLSGGVYGKRSKIEEVSIGKFSFKDVNVAFPDSLALQNLILNSARQGTMGSDLLRRFTVIMDYPSKQLTLRKNAFYNKPFHYNMSGIVVEHGGMVPIKSVKGKLKESFRLQGNEATSGAVDIQVNPLFTFFLTPKLVVAEIREGSPAQLAGVALGDEILSINGKPFYDWKLSEISSLFASKSGKKIVLQLSRNGIKVRKRFTLKEIL